MRRPIFWLRPPTAVADEIDVAVLPREVIANQTGVTVTVTSVGETSVMSIELQPLEQPALGRMSAQTITQSAGSPSRVFIFDNGITTTQKYLAVVTYANGVQKRHVFEIAITQLTPTPTATTIPTVTPTPTPTPALPVEGLISKVGSSHPVGWSTALGPDKIGLLDRESKQYCEIDYAGKIVRPLSKLEIDEPTEVTGIVLLPNGDRLLTLDIPQKDNDRLRYGVTCGVVQVTDAAGGLSLLSRHDLMPAGPNRFVTAIGSHNGKPVFFGRGPDRMLIFG